MYGILRWIAGVALHWFYGDIRVVGAEKIPRNAPLLIAVNHFNALVDSLLIGWLMPRRVVMTAKATLTNNPMIAVLFRALGVVPLRRTVDEKIESNGRNPSPARNSGAFREMLDVLKRNGAVLIFPEGTSHSNQGMVPLKSGLARVALQARERKIVDVQIVPIGLVFENKSIPDSGVRVQVGDPIAVDRWPAVDDHIGLTVELSRRLRLVTETELPSPKSISRRVRPGRTKRIAISVAAAWGRLTHKLPIRIARKIAVRLSTDADQPAMFTIVIGLGLVLTSYMVHFALVDLITHSFWIASLYVATLLTGAYWAAFEPHLEQ
ncbi:MAG TPA: 1-acyl-sn-glycerol-3-phosphate acyltransferase [Gemmatimonadaceae bacterium]|jgi:1-acyl-sn-glycerol-3-phosphate acyltransferase|nr:1-acyl-sn-glycerol-3-phosphate acyltransferase [Gemmatimonadaceae bacterium]